MSTAFAHNQVRASNLGDASILPDLCMSHSNHLKVMLSNHNKLLDIEKRFMKAKEELADNLSRRLQMVVYIQSSISDLDSKLLFHHRCFRRLKHHLVIIEQIHHAPTVYVTAVTEVVRRRLFSNGFMKVNFPKFEYFTISLNGNRLSVAFIVGCRIVQPHAGNSRRGTAATPRLQSFVRKSFFEHTVLGTGRYAAGICNRRTSRVRPKSAKSNEIR